ncbi:IclR family transcriptional regulator [Herbiconiux solani]|uniref:IclR family transcriptional regulator n=1 Tax=Herbiconiux solani TaxID=661329 RepID=UPI0008249D7B|nr:helix-turn-helix domain-containing protein [Herbiconiux solani]
MPPEYAVPALEKALDILETLAETPEAMSQLEIALAVDRSPSQIFRVLTTLERRGYLYRDPQSGAYSLSLRLFDLSHRQEPLRSLTEAALGPMRELAAATGQSCNLSVREGGGVRVVAQVESPADFGFRVRVGALFPLETTATGAVLAAFAGDGGADAGAVADARARIRADGHLERSDSLQPSITDLVFPVLNRQRVALAALTVPYVATSFSTVPADRVRDLTGRAAAAIGAALGL